MIKSIQRVKNIIRRKKLGFDWNSCIHYSHLSDEEIMESYNFYY